MFGVFVLAMHCDSSLVWEFVLLGPYMQVCRVKVLSYI